MQFTYYNLYYYYLYATFFLDIRIYIIIINPQTLTKGQFYGFQRNQA